MSSNNTSAETRTMPKGGRPRGTGAAYENRATVDEVNEILRHRTCNASDAGKLLGLHRETVVRFTKQGKIPGIRFGRSWRYDTQRLIALLG